MNGNDSDNPASRRQADVEDLLHSIRRLVAQEGAPSAAPQSGRLVLGALSRVAPGAQPTSGPDGLAEAGPAPGAADGAAGAERGMWQAAPPPLPQPELQPAPPLPVESVVTLDQHQPAPMYDEAELRGIVAEIVREELAGLMDGALEHRIRRVLRRELAGLLASGAEQPDRD